MSANGPKCVLTLQRINLAGRRGGRKASFAEYNQFYQQGEIASFPVAVVDSAHPADTEPADWLQSCGLQYLTDHPNSKFFGTDGLENAFCFPDANIAVWAEFCTVRLAELKQLGWQVVIDDSFYFSVATPDKWYGTVSQQDQGSGNGIELDYGIMWQGRRISMIPVLANLLPANPAPLLKADPHETLPIYIAEANLIVELPTQKIGEIGYALTDLFSYVYGKLEVHPLRAAQLIHQLGPETFETTALSTELAKLGDRVANSNQLSTPSQPEAISADLRTYQLAGLAWLQFLRENDLGGILADDMGLGKTLQTLASISIEKTSGRMVTPALIVVPTSVLYNWISEAKRFAPSLNYLLLHGLERESDFDHIREYDLVVTSYALLNRDIHIHRKIDYHYAILDEAQLIKNPKSQIAQSACELKAKHRLCLSGTPLENHLGELWSLIHFLLPGFAGHHEQFRKHWQLPIEKRNDEFRRERLVQKISPLLLRRTKDKVLEELPARTDIVHEVLLEQGQSTLYEKVRAQMDKKVRDTLESKGIAGSHMVVLDGLLKLRQICCDPRLLDTAAARKLKKSAKLEAFEELVAKQVASGRKILVFSQFTSMISLLEASLDKLNIEHVKLIGSTTKREKVIENFQNQDIPVFLISLKAGGFGLNLTEADCVIHYDPWWNPAVEEQATARAHRMGQDKPVFVYRLVTKGSIEERILELQRRKADLAEAVLSGEEHVALDSLSENDVERFFAPMTT